MLVTNDFPPALGGIQSYLYELVRRMDPRRIVVLAPAADDSRAFDAGLAFPVVRHTGMLLPTPGVLRTARRLLAEYRCETVWFGAAVPLGALAAPLRAAGARRIVASTHGHEVGWAMVPGARNVLRLVGRQVDAVTFVSRYTRRRIGGALGRHPALEHVPPAVDTERFAPDPVAGTRIRRQLGLGERRVLLFISRLVPRKGADALIVALPSILRRHPDVVLLLAGSGRDTPRLRALAAQTGVTDRVVFAGKLGDAGLADWYNAADAFAMPCRTRGFGLDVEGFGMVFLEAAACGLPVVVGDSGGAPETVRDGETGYVVDGRRVAAVADAVSHALTEPSLGAAGREWACRSWRWDERAAQIAALLDG